jgi:hypothetical protein
MREGSMSNRRSLERAGGRPSHVSILRILGGAALVLVAVGVITQFHDIRRYINMVRM